MLLRSSRRRLLLVAVTMIAVVIGAELGARVLAPYLPEPLVWGDEATQLKVRQMEARGCADLVVAGNSMARDDVQPAVLADALGLRAYNASLDAAGPDLLDRWLEGEVLPRLEPHTVVLAVSSIDLNDNSAAGRAATESYSASVMGRRDWIGRLGAEATERSDLVRYRTELRQPSTLWHAALRAARGDEVDRGSVGSDDIIGPDGEGLSRRALVYDGDSISASFARTQLLNDFSLGGRQLESTRALLTDLHESGVNVVLVILPVTDDYVSLHPGGSDDFDDFRTALEGLATDSGSRLVDLHDRDYDNSLFADTHHLNEAGSQRLSKELADELSGEVDASCST